MDLKLREGVIVLVLALALVTVGYITGRSDEQEINMEEQPLPADDMSRYYMQLQAAEGYSYWLASEGYSEDWASHKAFVEVGLIEQDSLYWAIEED